MKHWRPWLAKSRVAHPFGESASWAPEEAAPGLGTRQCQAHFSAMLGTSLGFPSYSAELTVTALGTLTISVLTHVVTFHLKKKWTRMKQMRDECDMAGKWNLFQMRANKNASALNTALNTLGELCLSSSNRINPHRHCAAVRPFMGLCTQEDSWQEVICLKWGEKMLDHAFVP